MRGKPPFLDLTHGLLRERGGYNPGYQPMSDTTNSGMGPLDKSSVKKIFIDGSNRVESTTKAPISQVTLICVKLTKN